MNNEQGLGVSEELRQAFEEVAKRNQKDADQFWDSLSYEDKCNAFHAVVSKICQAEIVDQGSYRHALYGVFGFGPDMYTRGMDCGFMGLHNSIMTDEQFNEANKWMCGDENDRTD